MINAKIQIDALLNKNKIVIISDDESFSQVTYVKKSKKKEPLAGDVKDSTSDRLTKEFLKMNEALSYETDESIIIQLFDLYGVDHKYISIAKINKLVNVKECEIYLQKRFANGKNIKVLFEVSFFFNLTKTFYIRLYVIFCKISLYF